MRVLLALDSFKGSLRAQSVALCLQNGLQRAWRARAHVRVVPLGDGGEGTLEALCGDQEPTTMPVCGPDGQVVQGAMWIQDEKAWIEVASACGLEKVTTNHPSLRTSYGVGQLVLAAVEAGAKQISLGCGGTATVDLGLGMLQALGAVVELDGAGANEAGLCMADLARVRSVDLGPALRKLGGVELVAAVDVTNRLGGSDGAVEYALQKGAKPDELAALQAALEQAGASLEQACGESVGKRPGAGAAGGIPAALMALGGRIETGFEAVAAQVGLGEALLWADVVVTGEGRLDATTGRGKVVSRVLERCQGLRPCWVVAGQASFDGVKEAMGMGAMSVMTLARGGDEDIRDAIANPEPRLELLGFELGSVLGFERP